ncbi:Hypothetical predicted protein [Olea europaea subsp. europaea]|uniref:Uncharacterized protein n=1 Tax=Olea europaea subsp. europaea TaxID=158383 RepID=A0A8S0VFT4_OLEEU|nr:Hypothetical predicted protein [Olea europaea subsp. europaea]
MSPKKKGITPSQTKEHVGEETSSQNAPVIQEPLPTTPVVRHQRSGSRNRPRLAARLIREMAVITANMRAISRQNALMCKLLRRMQSQLARSSQKEEKAAGLMHQGDRPVSSIGLVLQETVKVSTPNHPLKSGALLFPPTDHTCSIPYWRKISMDNLSQEPQMSSLLDTCIPCLEIGEKDEMH